MNREHSMNLFKSCLLFCIAFVLVVTTTPIGFVYAILRQFIFHRAKTLSRFFVDVAIALDAVGNVMMQHLLNDTLLIKNNNTYFFGNKKETISSVIGKNSLTHTLSFLGNQLNNFLNFIDKGHSLDSIIYDVKTIKENKA